MLQAERSLLDIMVTHIPHTALYALVAGSS
jgi:hypothetical protein